MNIPVIFLGTSQAIPTASRNHTSILIKYKQESFLVDCGEGTQRQFRKAKINPCRLTRLLITHWHGDHVLGIPGLFQTLALNNYNKTLKVYCPPGTCKFVSLMQKLFVFKDKIKIKTEEVNARFFETEDFYLEAFPLNHGVPANAYAFVEKDRLRIDKKKLEKLKIPSSPLIGELQKGRVVKINGKTVKPEEVTYSQKGKKIVVILDTKLTEGCYKFAKDADLLIAEATYSKQDKDLADENKHLTAEDAARIAKKAKCKKLILTHISQRYQKNESVLLEEAKKIFKNTELAFDLMKTEV